MFLSGDESENVCNSVHVDWSHKILMETMSMIKMPIMLLKSERQRSCYLTFDTQMKIKNIILQNVWLNVRVFRVVVNIVCIVHDTPRIVTSVESHPRDAVLALLDSCRTAGEQLEQLPPVLSYLLISAASYQGSASFIVASVSDLGLICFLS